MESCCIVVVGDGIVGKTCLLYRYAEDKDPDDIDYVPTVFENYAETVKFEGADVNLQLWDTAGQEEYEKLRVLAYHKSDVFLLCFDVSNPTSLEHCKTKWYSELKAHNKCPIILVGTKLDLADDVAAITQFGRKIMRDIKAADLFLTSSKTGVGVQECFERAIEIKLKRAKRQCSVL